MTLTLTATASTRLNFLPQWSGGFPPDSTLSAIATPPMAVPTYLTPVIDPTTGGKVTAIDNVAGVRNNYSRPPVDNSNGTLILLAYAPTAHLLDGVTYAVINNNFAFGYSPKWSNTVPNKIFDTQAPSGLFRTKNPLSGGFSTVHTFAGDTNLDMTGEGALSDDDHYVAFCGLVSGQQKIYCYDIVGDTVLWTHNVTTRPHWVSVSPSGTYVLARWTANGSGAEQGTWQYLRSDGSTIRQISTTSDHADFAYDADGTTELFVEIQPSTAPVLATILSTGATRTVLAGGSAMQNGHVSRSRPGWVVMSNYNPTAQAGKIGCDQIWACKTDGSQTVEVFCFAHHTFQTDEATDYPRMPFANSSRDGKRVFFGGEWGATNVYAYVVQAP